MKNFVSGSDPHKALSWMNGLLQTKEQKIEHLGNGLCYCLILNKFYPQLLPLVKINKVPKNVRDYRNNLKLFSEAIRELGWSHISFDILKASAMSVVENGQLLVKIHHQLCPPVLKPSFSFPLTDAGNLSNLNYENSVYIGLATPMKLQHKTYISPSIVQKIKEIVKLSIKSDREKVIELKNLLEMEVEEKKKFTQEEQQRGDELLEDDAKAEVIVIEDC